MPKRLWLLVALVLFTTPVAGQAPQDKQAAAGWEALQRGDGAGAAAAFAEALKRSPRDPALYVGAGAAAHLAGRDQDAIESLHHALALDPKLIAAVALLGQLEYQQGDLDAAIQRYEQALPFIGGDGAAVMERLLEGWRKEAAVHRDLTEQHEARFSVMFDGHSDNALASHTVALLERTSARIAEKIGAFPSQRILVDLYTEQQFRDVTQAPAWAGGSFDGKIRIPVKGASQNMEQFDHILAHELTHAMIYGLAPRGVPGWLNEGLASYFEPRDAALAAQQIHARGAAMPMAALADGFGRFNSVQAAVAYDESLVAVDILMRLVGTRMAGLLQALGSGQSFEQAMGQLGLQASDFEAQVVRHLKP